MIDGEMIAQIAPRHMIAETDKNCEVIDAAGKMVVPGLIDMHVHLREPGHEYKETVASGARAAVVGGFTAVACMPNTSPPNDCSAVTEFIIKQGIKANLAKIYPIATITKGQRGETLTEFGDLRAAGAVGVSDDGLPVVSSELMRRAIEYAGYHAMTVISHCEDLSLSQNGVMHEGTVSTRIGLQGIPSASEEVMVSREIALSKLTGGSVHIAHVSTEGSVQLIRGAKAEGVRVTAETAPHYFTLDHSAVIGFDTNAKMNPPLRTSKDVEAVKRGLSDGTIDVIASDHAPHSALEKELEFDQAAFGIVGLETTLSLSLELVREGVLSWVDVIKKLSFTPALLLGIEGGRLLEGAPADLTIINPNCEFVLKADDIVSKSINSPFIGRCLKGVADLTIIGGRIVWERSKNHLGS
jgi:dihydroorotase